MSILFSNGTGCIWGKKKLQAPDWYLQLKLAVLLATQ